MKASLSELGLRIRTGLSLLELRELRARPGSCPFCGPTLFLKLSADPLGMRCVRCAAWPASMAMALTARRLIPDLAQARVYEASAFGPWVGFLRSRAGHLECSEYWEDVAPGALRDGVRCQDLGNLTFPDASFDLCSSMEVLEHVADEVACFRELLRVLVPGGWLLFTIPLFDRQQTVVRAVRSPDGITHRLPAEYHGDRIRGAGRVLVYREYGRDIVDRLAAAGFEKAEIREVPDPTGFGYRPTVVVARRPR